MSENNKIRLYSYSKVWRVKKKIYAIQNIILPAPIEPYDLLYFAAAAAVIMILGNLIPILRGIPTIIRFVVIPYGVTQFLTKKKLDGKNPIKYFIGYIYYVFAIRNTYIEKFKMYPDRKEERLKIKWFCSKGYSKRPLWDYNRFFGGNKKRRDKKKASQRTSVSKRDTSPKKNKKISEKRTQENAKKIRISSGPKLKANTKSEKDHSAEMVHKSLILEKKLKRLCKEVSEIINDPKTRETAIKIIKILFHFFSFLFKGLQKIISSLQARRSDKSSGPKAVDTTLEKRKKEKEPKPKADKKVAILENITLVISVCSLVPGVGSTHTAKALAYFIKHLIKKSVCIIDEKGNSKVNDINGIEVYKRDNLYELYDRYHYIIRCWKI